MKPSLPTLASLAGALPLPGTTATERIFAAYHDEHGPGLDGLSAADKLVHTQMEAAYALILQYHSFEQAWPLLAKPFSLSRPTCYRRLREAQNLFGDVKKVKKEGRRSVLQEYARKVLQLCLTQRPPDVKGAMAAMKFEADLAGLCRADTHGEDAGTGTGNTSYVLNLHVEGRKAKQYDLTQLENVTDVEFELIQEAIGQDIVGGDQMAGLLKQAKEGNGKL